ncbi:MAG: outer membrane beta-barrel protein [Dinghuibacter sp.]|nr:outer membrane beta-barrel protein [Dinghuibacter sp.]
MYIRKKAVRFVLAVITCLLFIAAEANAQRLYSGFGLAGLYTTGRYKDTLGVKKDVTGRYGMRAFWMGRINIEGSIFFSPEVGYTFKGFKVKSPETGVADREIILHYFDILLMQEYVINDLFFVKIGPSLSGAIAGRSKSLSTDGQRKNEPLPFNFAAWSRFDATILLGVGKHFGNGWTGEIRLSDGLSNIYSGDIGPNVKTRYFGVQFGKYLR